MSVEDFLSEAKLMHQLRHHKLVQLMAVCTKSEPIWIITELMVNGALLDFLRKDEGKTLSFKHIADMSSQVRCFTSVQAGNLKPEELFLILGASFQLFFCIYIQFIYNPLAENGNKLIH